MNMLPATRNPSHESCPRSTEFDKWLNLISGCTRLISLHGQACLRHMPKQLGNERSRARRKPKIRSSKYSHLHVMAPVYAVIVNDLVYLCSHQGVAM